MIWNCNLPILFSQDSDHFKCSECDKYLGGKILTAIYCETCDQYYHLNCFELDDGGYTDGEEDDSQGATESGNDVPNYYFFGGLYFQCDTNIMYECVIYSKIVQLKATVGA